ncbi:MAG: N-acetyl-gamma-glutamyl-phosphate reductase [Deltaproteobacteria bacterium]|nr:N-acetyl-gamma-glutamyl-phosphate reductase [Candidatus Zymogenaceae bacterium]
MIRTAIIGASGYTGSELLRLLTHHPNLTVSTVTSRQYAGRRVGDVFPHIGHLYGDLVFLEPDIPAIAGEVDAAFAALPHKTAMEAVSVLARANVPVVDLSADFRFRDGSVYEKWYVPHIAPELLERSAYGLPELYREEIPKAAVVGNPGCYPTGAILGLAPLLSAGVVSPRGIVVDSKSGVSGAGRSPSPGTIYPETTDGIRAYSVLSHRHTPEITEHLSRAAGEDADVTFTPHLMPAIRGILSTIYARTTSPLKTTDMLDILRQAYAQEPFVRVLGPDTLPDTRWVRGSNFVDIGALVDPSGSRAIVVTAIDNLVKGASGQAIQNMNLLMGFPEDTGLSHVPLFP